MFSKLFAKLWDDDHGAVIATEYLMLGTVVGLGGAAGLAEMRDSMNLEYKEFGNAVRDVRTQYAVPDAKGCSGTKGGTTAFDQTQQQHPQPGQLLPFNATP